MSGDPDYHDEKVPGNPLGLSVRQHLQSELHQYVQRVQENQEFIASLPDGTLVQMPDGTRVPAETLR